MERDKYEEQVLSDWDKNAELRATFNEDIHAYWAYMRNEHI